MTKGTFIICIDSLMEIGLTKDDAYKALRDIRRKVRQRSGG